VTLNDVTYVEAARALAERVIADAATDEARIEAIFRRVLARPPQPQESSVLSAALSQLKQKYQADAAAAEKLLKTGQSPRNEKLDPAEHAAWTALASAILNLDEALTKE
jgi:hypothetical protein